MPKQTICIKFQSLTDVFSLIVLSANSSVCVYFLWGNLVAYALHFSVKKHWHCSQMSLCCYIPRQK